MMISIGILAHNEARVIEETISSLFSQTVFNKYSDDYSNILWEIIVVPNGCTDDTYAIALTCFDNHIKKNGLKNITSKVAVVVDAGKSNAWNLFVHDISSPIADIIIMIDADIKFGEPETIANCISALMADARAVVVVDQPLKDAALKYRLTFLERFSVAASKPSINGTPLIAGSFYCARAISLREIWMPSGLPVEDGFLHAMVVTNCFREPVDSNKVIRAPNSTHYFETLTNIKHIFRHELRMVIGSALNCYLAWDMLYFSTDPLGPGAGVTIRNRMAQDPLWYQKLINNAILNHGWWVLPRGLLFRRFRKQWPTHSFERFKAVLTAIAAFFFDLAVLIVANNRLKRFQVVGFW